MRQPLVFERIWLGIDIQNLALQSSRDVAEIVAQGQIALRHSDVRPFQDGALLLQAASLIQRYLCSVKRWQLDFCVL